MAKEAWATDSGLPDDCDARVTDARFDVSEEFQRVQLVLELEPQDDDSSTFYGYYSVGSTDHWRVIARGAAVESTKGKNLFHKNSAAGELVRAIAEHAPGSYLDEADPKGSVAYVGLVAHWCRNEKTFNIDGNTFTAERLLPTKILKVPNRRTQEMDRNGGGDYRTQVETLLSECSTEDDFMQKALAVEGVLGDDEAEEFVAQAWVGAGATS